MTSVALVLLAAAAAVAAVAAAEGAAGAAGRRTPEAPQLLSEVRRARAESHARRAATEGLQWVHYERDAGGRLVAQRDQDGRLLFAREAAAEDAGADEQPAMYRCADSRLTPYYPLPDSDGDGDGDDGGDDGGGGGPACDLSGNLTDVELGEWRALVELFNATGGPEGAWTYHGCWDVVTPRRVCRWEHVGCPFWGPKRVSYLSVAANNLQGTVPSGWGTGLDGLRQLDLESNALSGTLQSHWDLPSLDTLRIGGNPMVSMPSNWTGVPRLRELYLSDFRAGGGLPANGWHGLESLETLSLENALLFGTFPANWTGLGGLQTLELGKNYISGSLPSELYGLDNLTFLSVTDGILDGTLPQRLDGVPQLVKLTLDDNHISGPARVPAGLSKLRSLILSGNSLTGGVDPAAFAAAPALEGLDLSRNPHLGGTLPSNWSGGPASLYGVHLALTALSGTLPGRWYGLEGLATLDVQQNPVSGTLPASWHGLGSVTSLSLGDCELEGTVPRRWPGLNPRAITLFRNRLSGTLPDALEGLSQPPLLSLYSNRLSGTVPHGLLCSVSAISLRDNLVSGELPLVVDPPCNVTALVLSGNRFAGTLPSAVSGLPRLDTLDLNRNAVSGTLPAAGMGGFPALATLSLSENRLSGTLPPGFFASMPALDAADLSKNSIEGALNASDLGAHPALRSLAVGYNRLDGLVGEWNPAAPLSNLRLSANRIAGDVEHVTRGLGGLVDLLLDQNLISGTLSRRGSVRGLLACGFAKLDLAHNQISGTLPADLVMSCESTFDLSENRLEAMEPVPWLKRYPRAIRSYHVDGNSISGAVPEHLCHLMVGAGTLDLSRNLFDEVPECLSRLSRLGVLRLDHNRIRTLPEFFLLADDTDLHELSLRNNSITSLNPWVRQHFSSVINGKVVIDDGHGVAQGPGAAPGADPGDGDGADRTPVAVLSNLHALDLSLNRLDLDLDSSLGPLAAAFPMLSDLLLSGCGLTGTLPGAIVMSNVRVLDLSNNPNAHLFSGTTLDVVVPAVRSFDLRGTPSVEVAMPRDSRDVRLGESDVAACLESRMLLSPLLDSVDLRGTRPVSGSLFGGGPDCRRRTLELVEESLDANRAFPKQSLTCPQWITRRSGAVVRADADFLRYRGCVCAQGLYWRWETNSCVPCPSRGGGEGSLARLHCDPRIDYAAHCVMGNYYPVDPDTGALPATADRLPGSSMLRCRLPGLCGAGAPPCPPEASQQPVDVLHTSPATLLCAEGHEPAALLCSKCDRDFWQLGSTCVRCHDALKWFVPLGMATAAAVVAYFLWRRSGRSDDGSRTVATAVLWVQLNAILAQSSQLNSGTSSGGAGMTWSWLERAHAVTESWLVLDPWALSCGWHRVDYLDAVFAAAAVPFSVAALAALAAAALPARLSRRVVYGAVWLLLSFFLPSTTRALSVFNCEESVPGHSFVSAAPYVACDHGDARFRAARGVAAATLALYTVPLLAAHAWLSRRASRAIADREATGGAARAAALAAPLLDDGEAEAEAEAEAEVGDAAEAEDGAIDVCGSAGAAAAAATAGMGASPPPGVPDVLAPAAALLLAPVRRRNEWWTAVLFDLGRKLLLALVVGLVPAVSPLLPVLIFLVLLLSLLLHTQRRPWQHRSDNVMETVVLSAALGAYLVGIMAGIDSRRGDSVTGHSTAVPARNFVSILDLAVYCGLAFSVYAAWARRRRRARRAAARKAAQGSDEAAGSFELRPRHGSASFSSGRGTAADLEESATFVSASSAFGSEASTNAPSTVSLRL